MHFLDPGERSIKSLGTFVVGVERPGREKIGLHFATSVFPPPRVCMLRIIRVMSDVGWGGTLRIHIPQLCCLIDSKEEVVSSNASKRL